MDTLVGPPVLLPAVTTGVAKSTRTEMQRVITLNSVRLKRLNVSQLLARGFQIFTPSSVPLIFSGFQFITLLGWGVGVVTQISLHGH